MKKLMVMVLCFVMGGAFIGCNADDNESNNSKQEQSHVEKEDGKENAEKFGNKFYSAQFMSIHNNDLEVIIMKEVDRNYDFNEAGKIEEAKEKDPNEKEESKDDESPYSVYTVTGETTLKSLSGNKLDIISLMMGDTILLEVKDNKLVCVVAE